MNAPGILRRSKFSLAIVVICLAAGCDDTTAPGPGASTSLRADIVRVETSMGTFEIELFPDDAPVTVANFERYVTDGFYEGLVFHRVVKNFMSQSGQFDENMVMKNATYPPIKNEAGNGLSNLRGTIGMARTLNPQSATCQFFINAKDNLFLDHKNDTPQGFGYAVFGRIRSGMDVVDAINNVPTGTKDGYNDVPLTPIFILKMTYVPRRHLPTGY